MKKFDKKYTDFFELDSINNHIKCNQAAYDFLTKKEWTSKEIFEYFFVPHRVDEKTTESIKSILHPNFYPHISDCFNIIKSARTYLEDFDIYNTATYQSGELNLASPHIQGRKHRDITVDGVNYTIYFRFQVISKSHYFVQKQYLNYLKIPSFVNFNYENEFKTPVLYTITITNLINKDKFSQKTKQQYDKEKREYEALYTNISSRLHPLKRANHMYECLRRSKGIQSMLRKSINSIVSNSPCGIIGRLRCSMLAFIFPWSQISAAYTEMLQFIEDNKDDQGMYENDHLQLEHINEEDFCIKVTPELEQKIFACPQMKTIQKEIEDPLRSLFVNLLGYKQFKIKCDYNLKKNSKHIAND